MKEKEKLKIKQGLEGEREVAKVLILALDKLIAQIKTHLDYYSQEHIEQIARRGIKPKKILLCGGGANLKGLSSFLMSKLEVDVKISNPLINLSTVRSRRKPRLSLEKSLGYTTVLGLALKNIYDN